MVSSEPWWGASWEGPVVISMASKGPKGVALCWGRWYRVGPGGGPCGYLGALERARVGGPCGYLDGLEGVRGGGPVLGPMVLSGPQWGASWVSRVRWSYIGADGIERGPVGGPVIILMASKGVVLC
jgi:hypothetical protein